MPGRTERRQTDRLYPPRPLGPCQLDALRAVEALPGLTIAGLASALGVSVTKASRIAERLIEHGRLERVPARSGAQPPSSSASSRSQTSGIT